MQSNAEESRAIQEIAGTHSEKQNNPRDCSAAQIHPGDFQEDTGSVATARHSFGRHQNCKCLAPTSVASVPWHSGTPLNAFGLFAEHAGGLCRAVYYSSAMGEPVTKERILKAVEELPDDVTLDEAIEKLCFLAKVERGLQQAKAGKTVSHDEVKERLLG